MPLVDTSLLYIRCAEAKTSRETGELAVVVTHLQPAVCVLADNAGDVIANVTHVSSDEVRREEKRREEKRREEKRREEKRREEKRREEKRKIWQGRRTKRTGNFR